MKYCKRCIMHDGIEGVIIDEAGECNYCKWDKMMNKNYPINVTSFNKLIEGIKTRGTGHEYDVVIGLSGGCDSSYLLKKMVESGIRCLGIHFDNNWNTVFARENMNRITDELGVDFKIRHVDRKMYDSLCMSFLLASVPDADIPNDIALAVVAYQEAEKNDIPTILDGHSFRTEGTCPTSWTYMDGKYIESVNNAFLKTDISEFPNMLITNWLRWIKIPRLRPLYYLNYIKSEAKKELEALGWKSYSGIHAENKYTTFVGSFLWYFKFNQDLRYVAFSAMIRNRQMKREEALKIISEPQVCPDNIMDEVKKRLDFVNDDFYDMLNLPVKSHHDYETYDFSKMHQIFDEYREFLPKTFIDKYVDQKI